MKYSIKDLVEMMSYRRGADSPGEKEFIKVYLDSIPGMRHDSFGNRFIRVGKSDTCFACHTDTVHDKKPKYTSYNNRSYYYKYERLKTGGFKLVKVDTGNKNETDKKNTIRQNVIVRGKWAYKEDGDILGADDTTGIWLCLNMISAGIPGLYIFHRKEEIGRLGSEWIAKHKPSLLKDIKKVVSFDRKGYDSVITFQSGERTSSEEFASELAKRLGGQFRPDDTGSYTDSYSYRKLVPECTNISIGYFNGHSPREKQDLNFAYKLAKKVVSINWSTLPVKRNPSVEEFKYQKYARKHKNYGMYNAWDYWGWESGYGSYPDYAPHQVGKSYSKVSRDTYSSGVTHKDYRSYYCSNCGQHWADSVTPTRCPFCSSYAIVEEEVSIPKSSSKKTKPKTKSAKKKKTKIGKRINLLKYVNKKKPTIGIVKTNSKSKKRWPLFYDYY